MWPGWLELAGGMFAVILFLPMVGGDKIRYYSCYVCYVVGVSTFGMCLIPVFLLRPKDPINLVVAGNTLKHLTRLLGIEWELRRGEILSNKDHGGSIVTINHQTIFDVMGLFNIWDTLGRATVIAKRELMWVPPFGPVAWLAGLVYIDRNDPKTANMQIQKASKDLLCQKIHLCVFPEGTRNKTGGHSLLPFKNGAFRVALDSQAPIIPVVFSPYYFIDSKNKLFRTGKVIVSVLEPIETKGLTMDDLETLREKTYKLMSEEYSRLTDEVNSYK